jgi:hypothetical protein
VLVGAVFRFPIVTVIVLVVEVAVEQVREEVRHAKGHDKTVGDELEDPRSLLPEAREDCAKQQIADQDEGRG